MISRRRTKLVYTMYSRKPDVEVWTNLSQLGVDYAILEAYWCLHQQRYLLKGVARLQFLTGGKVDRSSAEGRGAQGAERGGVREGAYHPRKFIII